MLKKYAKFPGWLPLPCHIEHGWTPLTESLPTDLETQKPLMLVYSQRRKDAWKKASKIPVEIIGAPFIHYKNLAKFKQSPKAKGTIVFPNHSMPNFEVNFNAKEFCRKLKKLPADFQPITVCLYWYDYIDPKSEIYREAGFEVVTTGPKLSNSLDFAKNFYRLLADHKYACSNDIGSYTFYAVDFGVPFFLIGEIPTIINQGARDKNVPERAKNDDFYWGKKAVEIFSGGPVREISKKQKEFVEQEMGVKECLSSKKLNLLLWYHFRENKYWHTAFLKYFFHSIITAVIFNGPWIKYLLGWRLKKLSSQQ